MAKIGRPKGTKNKDFTYSFRMDEETRKRLEAYCIKSNKSRTAVVREAILQYIDDNDKNNKI